MSVETFSGNTAGRFSRNDITPSIASAEAPRAAIAGESTLCASIGSSAPSPRHIIWRVRAIDTGDVLSAISRASS